MDWYYARGGVQQGPVSFEQLVQLAANGGLDPKADLVWNASMSQWTLSGQVPGLFGATLAVAQPDAGGANPYSPPQSQRFEPSIAPVAADVLDEIVPGSDPIDPVQCFSRAFELTKRRFGEIILVGLVYLACTAGPSFVLSFIDAMVNSAAARDGGPTGFTAWSGVSFLLQIGLQVLSIFLQLGLIRVGLTLLSGREASVGLLFGEGDKLLRVIGATILYSIAVLVGLLLLIVPGVYIMLRYGKYMTAIVDRDLGIVESFEYSSSITTDNRGNLFLLALINFAAIIIGAIPCFLGLIFLGPVVWLAGLVAYRWMQYGRRAAQDHPGTTTPMLADA
jgi:GYF domain 2